jgi:hypothetical protein
VAPGRPFDGNSGSLPFDRLYPQWDTHTKQW